MSSARSITPYYAHYGPCAQVAFYQNWINTRQNQLQRLKRGEEIWIHHSSDIGKEVPRPKHKPTSSDAVAGIAAVGRQIAGVGASSVTALFNTRWGQSDIERATKAIQSAKKRCQDCINKCQSAGTSCEECHRKTRLQSKERRKIVIKVSDKNLQLTPQPVSSLRRKPTENKQIRLSNKTILIGIILLTLPLYLLILLK